MKITPLGNRVLIQPVMEEEKTAIVITVYQPNPDLWIDYEKRRK